jgi:hypothetical protein
MLLSRRQEALVIVPSGNVLNTIVGLQKRLNAVRSGLSRKFIGASMAEPELASRVL